MRPPAPPVAYPPAKAKSIAAFAWRVAVLRSEIFYRKARLIVLLLLLILVPLLMLLVPLLMMFTNVFGN